jgi:hypothetical protein
VGRLNRGGKRLGGWNGLNRRSIGRRGCRFRDLCLFGCDRGRGLLLNWTRQGDRWLSARQGSGGVKWRHVKEMIRREVLEYLVEWNPDLRAGDWLDLCTPFLGQRLDEIRDGVFHVAACKLGVDGSEGKQDCGLRRRQRTGAQYAGGQETEYWKDVQGDEAHWHCGHRCGGGCGSMAGSGCRGGWIDRGRRGWWRGLRLWS